MGWLWFRPFSKLSYPKIRVCNATACRAGLTAVRLVGSLGFGVLVVTGALKGGKEDVFLGADRQDGANDGVRLDE